MDTVTALITELDDGQDVDDLAPIIVKVILDEHRDTAEAILYHPIRAEITRARRRMARLNRGIRSLSARSSARWGRG